MKKIIFILLTVAVAFINSYSQQTTENIQALTKQSYLTKSKKQKKTAWILLGSGVAGLLIGGTLVEGKQGDNIEAAVLGIGGMASMITSVSFFIASGKNKRKAKNETVFFKMETAPVLQGNFFNQQTFQSAGLRLGLR